MKKLFFFIGLYSFVTSLFAQEVTPAFPGAEGFACYTTTGGRGGKVCHVTNLNDSGEGSLRAALETPGSRIVVFDISGTISLESDLIIRNGNLTIAGQTAPGDGICIKNYGLLVEADNVIIRFIRCRMGDERPGPDGTIDRDALSGKRCRNVIIDHCSVSWSTDECASFYDMENFTMQWCIISESLHASLHPKGPHGYGGIWGGSGASFHHNLLAHHVSRTPRFCGSRYNNNADRELVDFRNNVIYNWGEVNGGYAGEGGSYNMVNNYYKAGPATGEKIRYRIFHANADDGTNRQPKGIYGTFYVKGNYMEGQGADWDWKGVSVDNRHNKQMTLETICSENEYPAAPVTTHSAPKAYEKVLMYAGASHRRDVIDRRIVRETEESSYTFTGSVLKGKGIIDSQQDTGGWPELEQGIKPMDTDKDGIPDEWAINHLPAGKLYNEIDPVTGYCYLELYINSLVEDIMKAGNEEAGSKSL